jgi:hypothetical protein
MTRSFSLACALEADSRRCSETVGNDIPFEERGGALRQLSAGLILGVDDRSHLVVRQVVGNGVFEMGWEVGESELAALEKQANKSVSVVCTCGDWMSMVM